MDKIKIQGRYYREAARFTSEQVSRYVLRALRIEPHPAGGAVVIATDGHTLCVLYDEKGECKEPANFIVDAEMLPFLKDHTVVEFDDRYATVYIETVIISTGGRATQRRFVVAFESEQPEPGHSPAFPDWRAVVDHERQMRLLGQEVAERITIGFNASYLDRAALEGNFSSVTMHIDPTKERATIVRPAGREDVFCLVMPLKDAPDLERPAWLPALLTGDPPIESPGA